MVRFSGCRGDGWLLIDGDDQPLTPSSHCGMNGFDTSDTEQDRVKIQRPDKDAELNLITGNAAPWPLSPKMAQQCTLTETV